MKMNMSKTIGTIGTGIPNSKSANNIIVGCRYLVEVDHYLGLILGLPSANSNGYSSPESYRSA